MQSDYEIEFLRANELPKKVEALAEQFSSVKIAVAYLKEGGLNAIEKPLSLKTSRTLRSSKKTIKLLVGLAPYYITDPKPLKKLLRIREKLKQKDLGDRLELRYYGSTSFHPKMFLFEGRQNVAAIIGSSNMTGGGTKDNTEANVAFTTPSESELAGDVLTFFDSIWNLDNQIGPEILTFEKLAIYARNKKKFEAARKKGSGKSEKLPSGVLSRQSGFEGSRAGSETVGWVLNHRVGAPHGSNSPEEFNDELSNTAKTGGLWHWTGKAPFAEGGPYLLILARAMEIYGHAVAYITQDIDDSMKGEGYVFAFQFESLYLLEKHRKQRIPLRNVIPLEQLGHFYSLIKLSTHPWIIKNYERLARVKVPEIG